MKRILLLALLSIISFSCGQSNSKDKDFTVIYLIRHAEKDRSDASNRDPNLNEEGKQRADGWAKYFDEIKLDKVYSTNYNRTKETAVPTAESKDLELEFYDPGNINGPNFIKENKNKTVLIVGHSNTTPAFANALLGEKKYKQFDDRVNSNLIVVTIDKEGNKSSSISQVD
ncbi:SixA phosphatase family protein [Winogradskyella litorisediminis]|uniref:SixA phosphatase family protein n=1 Tax=Winogradskyella litorisediminis TaxID=1156618 RepID=A0ABW3N9F7_9FLAO